MEVSHTASLLLRDNAYVYFRLLRTQFRFLKAWKALPMDTSSRLRAEQFLGDSQTVHLSPSPRVPRAAPLRKSQQRQLLPVVTHPQKEAGLSKGWLHERLGTSSSFCQGGQKSSAPVRGTVTEHILLKVPPACPGAWWAPPTQIFAITVAAAIKKIEEGRVWRSFSNQFYIAVTEFWNYSSKYMDD